MNRMQDVRQGMRVVDAAGEDVGTVEELKMGDSDAQTPQGQTTGDADSGLMHDVAQVFTGGEPDVPPEMAERMLRLGYIKIDAKGVFSGDLYAVADRIDHVARDTVHLNVERSHLLG